MKIASTKTIAPGLKVTITAVLRDLGQGPYFSMTYDEREYVNGRWREGGGGAGVDRYADHFPELVNRYARWHLVNVSNGPLYYIENALFWAGFAGWGGVKENDPPNWQHLLDTIIWGAAPNDTANAGRLAAAYTTQDREALVALLAERLPALMTAFDADMTALFGPAYTAPERHY